MREELSAGEARRLALAAQGLLGRETQPRTAVEVLGRVAAIQLDTISVLARSHELVCYARAGSVGRPAVEAACWGRDGTGQPVAFEYWGHAACIMPIELWPWFAFRRRALAARPRWGGYVSNNPVVGSVLRRLAVEGPLTSSDLGPAKNGGDWWDWSPMKVAVERLLDLGEVICTTRRGWRRVYDLTERALPPAVAAAGSPSDEECWRALIAIAGRCLGVATVKDLAEYFRLPVAAVTANVADSRLIPVSVGGWGPGGAGPGPAWADPAALAAPGRRGRHRATLLSPFDSMVWDRPRTARIFGFAHRIEAYTPAPARVHGYYVMPLLAGGELIGRVDPKRVGATLLIRQISLNAPYRERELAWTATALLEAATWVGCDAVAIERSHPEGLASELKAVLDGVAALPIP
ncbi:MAG TPA: crosslink repair DNA glycosylase YcaQ family protein [Acidimicrobiales bacterium]|jgi:hypothetical protein|nr:crosslink repair DNA glycosylase YcaQ family protein [Acidimicrobiales bacterium]